MSGNSENNQETTGFSDLSPIEQILSIQEREEAPTEDDLKGTKDPAEQGASEEEPETLEDNPAEADPEDDEGETEEVELPEEVYELDDTDFLQIGDEAISIKELREGNLRQADYTKKTQALADQKKEFEESKGALAEEYQSITQLRASLAGELEAFQGDAEKRLAALDKLDWNELKEVDPEEFMTKKLERAELRESLDTAKADKEKLVQDQIKQNTEMFNQQRDETNRILSSEQGIPGWGDETKGLEIRKDMLAYAESVGFTKEELNFTLDPRLLKVLHTAAQAAKAPPATQEQVARKKLKPVPRVTKPGHKARQTKKQSSLHDRLHKEQSTGAAADMLFDMLQRGK